jgi:hypothetical protein
MDTSFGTDRYIPTYFAIKGDQLVWTGFREGTWNTYKKAQDVLDAGFGKPIYEAWISKLQFIRLNDLIASGTLYDVKMVNTSCGKHAVRICTKEKR